GSRVGPRPIRAQTEVRRAARKSAGRIVFQRMPETTSNDSLREEFNRWAEAGRGEGMEQEHLPITLPVLEKMRLGRTDNVLDVGCGAGWLSRRLAKLVPEGRVIGMDISDEMVRRARGAGLDHDNLLFVVGEAAEIPWEANFFFPG